ncbi:MAG: homoserine kinase [Micavibrio aeruginosavorus]|uniref:Homoserine kinase n=1 Tax=Micavibrio aeruginosavorus TaxID=349221 RepID=A0A7T5R440_9BACT|nr:MAG: homoserine kinase [Micavibrio aeruginosavorus]
MAVFTPLDSSQIRDLLALYQAGDYVSHEGILEGVWNTNFHVHTTKSHMILTVFEERTNVDDLPFFFAYTDHLVRMGLSCPGPILTNRYERSVEIAGKKAALFPFFNGRSLTLAQITPEHCEDLGRYLARMHLAVADFIVERANDMSLSGWQKLADKTRARADEVCPGLSVMVDQELSWLVQHWPEALPRGAVHLDLFPDNVFFDEGKVCAVIDFYFSATDMLAYDLAIAINAWCFDSSCLFRPDCYRALLQGYELLRPLTFAEREALPVLLRAASVRFLMTRLHDWLFHDPKNFVKPHDPMAYVERLRFHQQGNRSA